MGDFPLCFEGKFGRVIIEGLRLEMLVIVARIPDAVAVEVTEETQIVGSWREEVEVGVSIGCLGALDHLV